MLQKTLQRREALWVVAVTLLTKFSVADSANFNAAMYVRRIT
jgi:hypothetical protein